MGRRCKLTVCGDEGSHTASVDYRYDEDGAPHRFKSTYSYTSHDEGPLKGHRFRREFNFAEILGAIRCYRYQSCACPQFERSGIPSALNLLTMEIAQALEKDKYGDNDGYGYWDFN